MFRFAQHDRLVVVIGECDLKKKLATLANKTFPNVDFWSARQIINRTDQAERIESYAMNWQTKLG